jgi:hypothetical protein
LQYAWNKAVEGVVMGGTLGGLYGAGGGFIIGLVAGLVMADSHYGAINNQIYSEQQKDQKLEAAIEQELARQRELENQIAAAAGAITPPAAAQPEPRVIAVNNHSQSPLPPETSTSNPPSGNVSLASVSRPAPVQSAPRPFKNVEVRDINGDGVPDSWIYYNPQKPGEIMRQEESSLGNGRVDAWSYFKDGHLIRREVDTKGQGRSDTVFYYVNDTIAREERDETGEGRMTYRATYENGRLAKVERETSGGGRTDYWIHYDTAKDGEIVIKEEKDLNNDGSPDVWSYYDNGRLVRRDVSAVGLAVLYQQEQLPISSAELKPLSPPVADRDSKSPN